MAFLTNEIKLCVCLCIILFCSQRSVGHYHRDLVLGCKDVPSVLLEEVEDHIYEKCMFLALPPVTSLTNSLLLDLQKVFQNDSSVFLGCLASSDATSSIRWKSNSEHAGSSFAFYAQEKRDRSCLLLPPKNIFVAEPYKGLVNLEILVQFLNEKCGTFRTLSGSLTDEGLLHQHIMHNLYVPEKPVESCQVLRRIPQKEEFFQDFAFRSKPFVLENGVKNWPAMEKWTVEYLRQQYGQQVVHIKLTSDGIFEGVESAKLWSDYREGWIPDEVKAKLLYPDLVVVRPATSEMTFSDFLDFISSGNQTFSAYLEYSSIPYYMPKLQEDISELSFVGGSLDVQHLNMWLSDGNTLGKLHFDPFDNFLCQVYT